MSRGVVLRLLLVIGVLAGATAIAVNKEPELGLDLRGGAQYIFEVNSTEDTEATPENVDRTLEVLRGRVDALGVAESTLVRQGDDRILVELPGITDEEEAAEAEERIGQTAQLSVHPVLSTVPDAKTKPSKPDNLVLPTDQGDVIEMGPAALQGDEITGAEAAQPQNSTAWVVNVDFSDEGSDAFGQLSARRRLRPGRQEPDRHRPRRPGDLQPRRQRAVRLRGSPTPPRSPATSRPARPRSSPP